MHVYSGGLRTRVVDFLSKRMALHVLEQTKLFLVTSPPRSSFDSRNFIFIDLTKAASRELLPSVGDVTC